MCIFSHTAAIFYTLSQGWIASARAAVPPDNALRDELRTVLGSTSMSTRPLPQQSGWMDGTVRREAPSPPLEGEVVERQRNRRGLSVNRAVHENPSVRFVGSEVPPNLPAPLSGAPLAKPAPGSIHPTAPPQLRVRSAAPPKGAPRALRARACAKRFLSGNEPGG